MAADEPRGRDATTTAAQTDHSPAVDRADPSPPRARGADSKQFGLFVRLAAVLGARRGELCGLRWEDVDFDRAR